MLKDQMARALITTKCSSIRLVSVLPLMGFIWFIYIIHFAQKRLRTTYKFVMTTATRSNFVFKPLSCSLIILTIIHAYE